MTLLTKERLRELRREGVLTVPWKAVPEMWDELLAHIDALTANAETLLRENAVYLAERAEAEKRRFAAEARVERLGEALRDLLTASKTASIGDNPRFRAAESHARAALAPEPAVEAPKCPGMRQLWMDWPAG